MKVLLLEDVYNLGRAGDVKKVANGYGRNFLLPQGLAVLATPGAVAQADQIRESADVRRAALNQEMSGVAEKLTDVQLQFPARAGETGKLYGSITTGMIAEALSEKTGVEITKRKIDSEPLRSLGMYDVKVRLTVDMIPTVKAVVYREGEAVENYMFTPEQLTGEEEMPVLAEEVVEVVEEVVETVEEVVEEAVEVVEETVEEATEESEE